MSLNHEVVGIGFIPTHEVVAVMRVLLAMVLHVFCVGLFYLAFLRCVFVLPDVHG